MSYSRCSSISLIAFKKWNVRRKLNIFNFFFARRQSFYKLVNFSAKNRMFFRLLPDLNLFLLLKALFFRMCLCVLLELNSKTPFGDFFPKTLHFPLRIGMRKRSSFLDSLLLTYKKSYIRDVLNFVEEFVRNYLSLKNDFKIFTRKISLVYRVRDAIFSFFSIKRNIIIF